MFKKSTLDLPRNKPRYNLFEYSIEENTFLRNLKSLSSMLTHPSVEGVYESHVDSIFRSVVGIGGVCGVIQSGTKNRIPGAEGFFWLDELEEKKKNLFGKKISYLHEIQLK
jgi:hypothetical protein